MEVEGLDLFEPMLSRLRRKAEALGLSPRLYTADMSDFRLPRRYALIMIPFNAFVHNLTQEAQIRCLERCREHLETYGGHAAACGLVVRLDKLDALGLFGMVLGLREQLESKPVPKPELRRATRLAGRPRSRNAG